MEATERFWLRVVGVGTERACETGMRCNVVFSLEAVVAETLRDSIHNFATESREEGAVR